MSQREAVFVKTTGYLLYLPGGELSGLWPKMVLAMVMVMGLSCTG
jgi:hypothetical protein